MKRIHSFTVTFSNIGDQKWLVDTKIVYRHLKCLQPTKHYIDFSCSIKSITQKVKRKGLNKIYSFTVKFLNNGYKKMTRQYSYRSWLDIKKDKEFNT